MNKVAMLAAAATFTLGAAAPVLAGDATDIQGYWVTNDQGAVVQIAPCGSSAKRLCGTLVWQADGAEVAAPVGAELLTGFRPVVDWWEKGKVTDVKTGRTLVGKLKPTDDGRLEVSQCKGGLCTSTVWQRPSQDMAGLETFLNKAGS